LAQFPWLVHGFSTRLGGTSSFEQTRSARGARDLNLAQAPGDTAKNVSENRRRWLACLQAKGMKLVLQRQVHSDLIRTVDDAFGSSSLPTGDALITCRAGLLLGVLAADCLPILLVDAKQRVVAALHCGWRGTARRLAEKAVGRMRLLFGSRPHDLWAAIGPGIRSCCYAIGPEVTEEFSCQFPYADSLFVTRSRPLTPLETKRSIMILAFRSNFGPRTKQETYLDLPLANLRQLRDAGVPENQIVSDAPCTSCHPELFFSHRRDAGHTGRMMGVVGIKA
jgi:YfiH family protein